MTQCALTASFALDYRATAEELLKEYKACESPDYITYVRLFVPSIPAVIVTISPHLFLFVPRLRYRAPAMQTMQRDSGKADARSEMRLLV